MQSERSECKGKGKTFPFLLYKYLSLLIVLFVMINNKPSLDEFPDVFVNTETLPENSFDLITLSDAQHVLGVATNNEEKKFIGWTICE